MAKPEELGQFNSFAVFHYNVRVIRECMANYIYLKLPFN